MSKNHPDPAMAQLTSVSQLADVPPTGWAFEALRSLVERYGCIVGYPDRTYRGDRALTRWEFAAGLNACLNSIRAIAEAGVSIAERESRYTQVALPRNFRPVRSFRAIVDNLENLGLLFEKTIPFRRPRNYWVRRFSWSPTPFKVRARGAIPCFKIARVFRFVSSFTGKDQLNVRLDAGNARRFNLGDGDSGSYSIL
jgi:hypothetical protein